MIHQALVAAGGKGTRLGILARRYGNKSLLEFRGTPLLMYTIARLREAGFSDILVTVNYASERRKIADLFRKCEDVEVVGNRFRKSSLQCVLGAKSRLARQFLFVYGHAPAPVAHIRDLVRVAEEGIAVSLYPSTSQSRKSRKPASVSGHSVIIGPGDLRSVFIEPPHVLTTKFVAAIKRCWSWREAFSRFSEQVRGVVAGHPPEFHYLRDLPRFWEYMKQQT